MANVRKKQIEQADDAKGAAAGQEAEQSTKQKVLSEGGKRTGMSALTAGFRTTDPNVKSPRQQRKQARIERDKRNEAIVEEQRAKNEAGFEKANAFAVADDEDYEFLTSDEYDIEDEPVVEEEEEEEEVIETKRSKLRNNLLIAERCRLVDGQRLGNGILLHFRFHQLHAAIFRHIRFCINADDFMPCANDPLQTKARNLRRSHKYNSHASSPAAISSSSSGVSIRSAISV